ncbi:3'-5' exoribonuclease [Psychrobacillus sp. INOP01]|uniref:exonuclease domain-containing protein n=1 Tax=Psychrobacillus sp. INOP01 TaxID=2829187 RepID=UPI001BA9F2BD|nr:exonuclease domain-containing protein [Psychrobacillus sp. INOP01]QUG42566.1 3'-5' exoribonuclease [Psychrobacillus sp. INOP01]
MAFEPFMQILRGIQGKRTNVGIGDVQSAQQMAFLRNLQKDMKKEDTLKILLDELKFVVFDIETTGFNPEQGDDIISIGAIKMIGSSIQEDEIFYSLIYSEKEIPMDIVGLTGITNEQLKDARFIGDVLIEFLQFAKDCTLVAHHANHERNFMQHASTKLFRTPFKHRIVDTSFLYKIAEPNIQLSSLEDLCKHNDIPIVRRHHALEDAKMTAKLWSIYVEKVKMLGCETLQDVYDQFARI